MCEDLRVINGERLDRADPARKPVRAWQTLNGEHRVVVGRLRGRWYVEHRSQHWRAHTYDERGEAMVIADRVRASIPGHAWIELEPLH
ncbi:hypothetical protein AB0I28_21835 [Phytomonospora sp. NPDC050363]|uniref:hypothetical protein n=1 Tax=Phytomonospora sp. NPDC050363 TaxID=3155642 RepID=UPI0033D96567